MSEVKRANLITFGAQRASPKRGNECPKTVRVSLVLPESNEDTYPEYNYKEELAAAKKRSNKNNAKVIPNGMGLDAFDDDSDVQRIAREMEAKYGTGVTVRKKRKGRKDDYADIGMGYDESDSFIDNTDGYDEMIPQNVTTLHGGFYINCGALEFKTDDELSSEVPSSSSDDDSNDIRKKTNSSKRALEMSEESEGEKETDKSKNCESAKKKIKLQNGTSPKIMKKKLLSLTHDKMKHIKKKHSLDQKKKTTVKELLRERREDLNMSIPPDLLSETACDDIDKESTSKENKKPVPMSNVSFIIESVVKASGTGNNNEVTIDTVQKEITSKEITANKIAPPIALSSEGESSRDGKPEEVEIVKLPENLPNDILDLINSIKDIAARRTEGKVKFFSGPVSVMLLNLEKKCKCLGKQSRLKVYEHLAPFVKCKKETLIRRAKNLVLESERKKIKDMSSKLKAAIETAMPAVLEAYERDCQLILQKSCQMRELYRSAWLTSEGDNEEGKNLRLPRKRMPWTEDMKKLVKELVQLRKKCFLLEGKQKDSIENLLEQYLKTDVLILWPEGWMSVNSLVKISGCVSEVKKSPSSSSHAKAMIENHSTIKKPGVNMPTSNDVVQNFQLNPVKEIQQNLNNPALSITPVTATVPKNNNMIVNSVKNIKSDINISKININDNSVSKTVKTMPAVEITKTNPSNVHQSSSSLFKFQDKLEKEFSPINCDIKEVSKEIKQKIHVAPTESSMKSAASPDVGMKSVRTLTIPESNVKSVRTSASPEISMKSSARRAVSPETSMIPVRVPAMPETSMKSTRPLDISMKSTRPNAPLSDVSVKSTRPVVPSPEINIKSTRALGEDLIQILDDPVQQQPQNLKVTKPMEKPSVVPNQKDKSDPKHCPIIDLTDHSDYKRKHSNKLKMKIEDSEKPYKTRKEELTGSSAFNQLIADSLSEGNKFAGGSNASASKIKDIKHTSSIFTSSPNVDYSTKPRTNEGDDIQKVMEGLKVLHKMSSSPVKSNENSSASSPVSVIAYNKNYAPKTTFPQSSPSTSSILHKADYSKADFCTGFQDAFQKQLYSDYTLLKTTMAQGQMTPTSSKASYNSIVDKYPHIASSGSSSLFSNDKYMQNSNNNYAPPNAGKLKNHIPSQQSGSYNLLDDMLTNFFTEYGYAKTAPHKPKSQQK